MTMLYIAFDPALCKTKVRIYPSQSVRYFVRYFLAEMAPNFTACGIEFQHLFDSGNKSLAYNGTVHGVLSQGDRPALITIQGCLDLCGRGHQLYTSDVWTNTVTTWVLPVVGGLLLQAPFESNRFWRTFFALMRWLGSPISSLSCVLWNIKVLGKCASMVAMAVDDWSPPETDKSSVNGLQPREEPGIPLHAEFANMRDSFYLLSVMNQFNIPPKLPKMSAEALLRVALFSDSLVLTRKAPYENGPYDNIMELREALAKDLRSRRRRGTVPVFISVGWFLVSLAISINTAFGLLGSNATAHNLALGLLLGWLPVFVIACIVDRNPVNTNDVRNLLNDFLDRVRLSLLDSDNQKTCIKGQTWTPQQLARVDYLFTQVDKLGLEVFTSFFRDFAGQGRTRWHYGVAHSVLAAVEDVGVADIGRGSSESLLKRHDELVLGPTDPMELHYFDWHEGWQILAATLIVFGTLLGAFVISIFTPTVGLGCRSGGYMIYFILTLSSFLAEMGTWKKFDMEVKVFKIMLRMSFFRRIVTALEEEPYLKHFFELPFQDKLDLLIFKPWDIVNTGWLIYIVVSQTFGLYNTCQCIGSTWGLGFDGGYVDFLSVVTYKAKGIIVYWLAGTVVSIAFLLVPSVYIFIEWLTQSHLSTEDYGRAMQGLRRTRRWMKYTTWPRLLLKILLRLPVEIARLLKSI